jgi:hypothetical protein
MRRRSIVFLFVVAGLLAAPKTEAASISLGTAVLQNGQTLLPINILGIPELLEPGVEISGYDLQATIGSLIPVDVTQGDVFTGESFIAFNVEPASLLTVFSVLIAATPGPVSDGLLATIVFAGAVDTRAVTLLGGNISRIIGGDFTNIDTVALTADNPQPIPEPSTLAMLGLRLAGLARGLRRGRRNRTSG